MKAKFSVRLKHLLFSNGLLYHCSTETTKLTINILKGRIQRKKVLAGPRFELTTLAFGD